MSWTYPLTIGSLSLEKKKGALFLLEESFGVCDGMLKLYVLEIHKYQSMILINHNMRKIVYVLENEIEKY